MPDRTSTDMTTTIFSPTRRRAGALLLTAATLTAALGFAPAWAQGAGDYPNRPITLVIPFPPGGSADTAGRLVAKGLSEKLGQPVVVDNRAGAGTVVGAGVVAKAPADGYTLLLSSGSTFTVNPAIRPNLPYDPVKSFDPIGIVGRIALILLANKDVPVNNVKEFVAAVKAAPQKYSYASFGAGTTSHFTAEIILQAIGAQLMHVPYKGSAPAMTDLMGGQVPFSVDTVTAAIPQVKAGKVKAIAVTTATRSSQLPDVPTFAEAGYKEVNADTWILLVAPKGAPPAVMDKLEKALTAVSIDPAFKKSMLDQGVEPSPINRAAAISQIERELPLMRDIARRANIQAD
nr:tripartite tricarboxylate transporter substrate binding protein [Hydrogenophaga palleronii]